MSLNISISDVGGRKFLCIEDVCSIPIDRIQAFDFRVANGGASEHSVQICTDDPQEEWIFAYENRNDIARFLNENGVLT